MLFKEHIYRPLQAPLIIESGDALKVLRDYITHW